MKERPILFSAPMVRAILAGTKTQTRRALKKAPADAEWFQTWHHPAEDRLGYHWYAGKGGALTSWARPCPYGQPGDLLWVRETWQHSNSPFGPYEDSCATFYRADFLDDPHGPDGEKSPEGKYRDWRPSIHMPRSASRINLAVRGVRVERLQAISEADARAEGVEVQPRLTGYSKAAGCSWSPQDPREAFCNLWESINGHGSWDANPWVWVVEFNRFPAPGAAPEQP